MTVPANVAAAAREAADAMSERLAESVDDEGPRQCFVVGDVTRADAAVNPLTFTGRIEGETRTAIPYAPPFFPNPGDVVWLRGPSGAKVATDRVNGGVSEHVIDALLTRLLGGLIAEGNLDAAGAVLGANGLLTSGPANVGDLGAGNGTFAGNLNAPGAIIGDTGIYCTGPANVGALGAAIATIVGNLNAAGAVLGENGLLTSGPANVGALGASTVTAQGNLNGAGAVLGGNGLLTSGPANVGPLGASAVTAGGNVGGNTVTSSFDINAGRSIAAGLYIIAGAGMQSPVYAPPGSLAELKTGQRPLTELLGESPLDVIERVGRAVHVFTYDPDTAPDIADGIERVGFNLDALPASLIVRPPLREWTMADHDEMTGAVAWEAGETAGIPEPSPPLYASYNLISLLNTTVAAVAQQRAEHDTLADRLTAVEARLNLIGA